MTRPTTDSTAAAESWLRSQRDLHALLDEALDYPEIVDSLEREDIPRVEARAVIIEDPSVLAQLRAGPRRSLWDSDVSWPGWGLRSQRLARARPAPRIIVAVVAIVLYLGLLTAAEPAMPLWGNLVGLAGLVGTVGFAVGLAGEDLWRLVAAVRRARGASVSWRRFALDDVIVPRLLGFIDERSAPDYRTTLSLRGVHNLYQDEDDAPVIITAAGGRLRRIMERSTSDAVAIAGYRGVGKTTAIRAAARGMFSDPAEPPPMAVIASAPSRYEARDFVLHLHAVLAKQVIALTGKLLGQPTPSLRKRRGPVWAALPRWLGIVVPLCALWLGVAFLVEGEPFPRFVAAIGDLAAMVFADFPSRLFDLVNVFDDEPVNLRPDLDRVPVVLVVTAAIVVTVSTVVVGLRWLSALVDAYVRASRASAFPRVAALWAEAVRQLDRIRFLQTYTSGWSGKVGIPLGSSDVGWTRGSQRAEQQLTHPEVVEAFREFAATAAEVLVRQGAVERILIAVDELDKIAEPAKANEFVNDIKGIFGVNGCLFLVAVSEDAIAAFERRGIPVRDAFDSAFSEMVRMDPFTLAESRRWMGRRLLGVPEPFSCLCHCLSGGLPRDLRRSTIDMIEAVRETGAHDLESVAASMVGRELDRKAHAFAATARQLDDSAEVTAHLADLLLVAQARTPAELVELAVRLAPREASTMPRMRWQSACFVLFCATVLEVFANGLTESGLRGGIELLATARAHLAVDPHVAWRVVCDVRDRYAIIPVPGRSARP